MNNKIPDEITELVARTRDVREGAGVSVRLGHLRELVEIIQRLAPPEVVKPRPLSLGDKVRFTGTGAFDIERRQAAKILKVRALERLTIKNRVDDDDLFILEFTEIEGWFNGAMFERVEQ